jgi:tripartite-type tricarboxylate transporter receptor subunit TctC
MTHRSPPPCPAQPLASRRQFLGWGVGCALGVSGLAPGAPAQAAGAFPQRPIQLIVPWPAGGATDLTLRILCEEAAPLLGQPIVVINKPGAAGTQVAPLLKAAEPDGHTLGQVPITVYRHALMNKVPWDPVADLSPIVQVSGTTFGVLVPAGSPWKSFNDLLSWAKVHPGELILGSTGIGTTAHLATEEILLQHNIRYVHVPYRGTADQMIGVAGGQVMAGVNSTGFAPWVDQGKVRVLAIFSAQRSPRWPDAPTLRELGYEQSVYTSPWGLAAPNGTPEAVVQRLHDAFAKAMHSERHLQELARYDQTLDYLNTRDYRQAVLDTVQREKRLLQRMNLLARTQGA